MMELEKRDILIIISLFLVAFLIRAAGVSNVCLYPDEWSHWTTTNRILASNWAPTAEVFDYSPPFFPYIAAVVTMIFDGDLNTLRMISVIFGSLTVPFLYLFGKAMYNRKTGLLSALFLCFSAYHCLFSRIFMLEAFTLFFVTAFLYFFWLSQRSEQERKGMTYAIIAGAMMGLAFDAKYISFFLIPAVLVYVLWTKKFNFKVLVDKRIILTFIFAFLFFLPLLICLFYTGVGFHGIYFYSIEKMESPVSSRVIESFPLDKLLMEGVGKMQVILTWGADVLIPTWRGLFLVSALLFLIITLFSYLFNFIKREKRGCFLIIPIFILYITLLLLPPSKHYLIYLFPFYFVMFSHLAVKSFKHLKENSYKNIFRTLIIVLTVIMLFSYFITGVTSPYWDEGGYSWAKSAVEYIKSDATKSGYEGHIIIGRITLWAIIDYSIYLSHLNASEIKILKATNSYSDELILDSKKIGILKPDYLIVEEHLNCLTGSVKRAIFQDYVIVFYSQTYPSGCFVLKRKNMQSSELLFSTDGKDGKISEDIFKRSIPSVMKVGKSYTVLVQVKNIGDSRTNFTVRVHSNKYIMFVEEVQEITLDNNSVYILKFKMVPLREYRGKLPITVDLYVRDEENETYRKVDSVSDYIYLIEK